VGNVQRQTAGATLFLALGLAYSVVVGSSAFADPALDALVAAYPDSLVSHDDASIVWKDGTVMPVGDGKQRSFDEMLNAPSIIDQFAIPYPLGTRLKVPSLNEDPGRIRNEAFFRKMYGDCRTGEVKSRLKPVAWLPSYGGGTLMATSVNEVANRLGEVSRNLQALPEAMIKYLIPPAGVYNCRPIAATERTSVHSYGAAIDISTRFADYWLWTGKKTGQYTWTNRIPLEIVDIFEHHGFIWGGKWYHFDTMHFEYRPELTSLAAKGWPRD
jgi:D-alanyl-D-alanine carboxypeptidase